MYPNSNSRPCYRSGQNGAQYGAVVRHFPAMRTRTRPAVHPPLARTRSGTSRGTGELSGDGRAGKASAATPERAGVCRREKCYAATRQRWTVGRWEKSPSQPCPSLYGGKPPVSLTVCLLKCR